MQYQGITLTLFCLGVVAARADFKCIVLKEHSRNWDQTLWLFLKIIWEHFDVSIVWLLDLMFPWQPSFDRSFYPNLVIFSFREIPTFYEGFFPRIFTIFASLLGDFLTFLNNQVIIDYIPKVPLIKKKCPLSSKSKMADPRWRIFKKVLDTY